MAILIILGLMAHGQPKQDSIPVGEIKFRPQVLILPAALMTYGIVAIKSDLLQHINTDIRDEFAEDIDEKFTIDDFSQYAPAAAVYALNNIGVQGKHNLRDRSVILATGYAMMATTVLILKSSTKIERPDASSFKSFPSGHTATAFLGAEFLWQEYKDVSIWYGITGYAVAAGTGYFRLYNGRHWLSDVTMGAGIGILSAKAAYWLFPYLNEKLFRNARQIGYITPFSNGRQAGVGLCFNLRDGRLKNQIDIK